MLKKPIQYENLDGENVMKEFHFGLTKAELIEIQANKITADTEGLDDYLNKIVKARSGKEIMAAIKEIIMMTVGERRGDLFVKNDEIRDQFMFSGAYSVLFEELLEPDKLSEFVKGIVPASMKDGVAKKLSENQATPAAATEDTRPPWIRENRPPTKTELTSMTKEELQQVMLRDFGKPVESLKEVLPS
jgi:hypothetical protein